MPTLSHTVGWKRVSFLSSCTQLDPSREPTNRTGNERDMAFSRQYCSNISLFQPGKPLVHHPPFGKTSSERAQKKAAWNEISAVKITVPYFKYFILFIFRHYGRRGKKALHTAACLLHTHTQTQLTMMWENPFSDAYKSEKRQARTPSNAYIFTTLEQFSFFGFLFLLLSTVLFQL